MFIFYTDDILSAHQIYISLMYEHMSAYIRERCITFYHKTVHLFNIFTDQISLAQHV